MVSSFCQILSEYVTLKVSLTISGHAHGETLLKATVLAPVSVHAHDEAVLVLYTHLVVDILLNAASEETLEVQDEEKILNHVAWSCSKRMHNVILSLFSLTLQPSQACTP